MPHVDVETLVSSCVGGNPDRKVNCETLAKVDGGEHLPAAVDFADVPPDFPPESFWLSKDAEIDWFDRNAFLERKESGKGISNSTNLSANNSCKSNSMQFAMKLKRKSTIFGILPTTQKTNYLDSRRRNNKPAHLFPKRSQSTGKSTVAVIEPSSPKVSCIGRVRSKRSRCKSGEYITNRVKLAGNKSRKGGKKGFCSRMLSIFNSGCGANRKTDRPEHEFVVEEEEARKNSTALKLREVSVCVESVAEQPPMLGGMKKFASGRKSGSDTDDFDVVPLSIQLGPTRRR